MSYQRVGFNPVIPFELEVYQNNRGIANDRLNNSDFSVVQIDRIIAVIIPGSLPQPAVCRFVPLAEIAANSSVYEIHETAPNNTV